jgi:hypothetical protein
MVSFSTLLSLRSILAVETLYHVLQVSKPTEYDFSVWRNCRGYRSANMLPHRRAIRDIPQKHRRKLVSRLSAGGIRRLWQAAGQRYQASPSAIAAMLGPQYSLWNDLPKSPGEIIYYDGKAALMVNAFGINSFAKALFLLENDMAIGEDAVYGRVIHPTPIGNWIYPGPMYFTASVGTTVVPSEYRLALRYTFA